MKNRIVVLLAFGLILAGMSTGCAVGQERIDRDLLFSHVQTLSSDEYGGRQTGTESGFLSQAYVRDQMNGMGLLPCDESLDQSFEFTQRRSETAATGTNLVGWIPGTGSSPAVIAITAHFDHLGIREGEVFNGADDNASGTGALLEIARYLVDHPPVHSIIIAALDAEEMGLQGARALVASTCVTQADVRLNINMDMISRSAAGELYAAGTYHYPALKPVLEGLSKPDGMELLLGHDLPGTGPDDWSTASDHGAFHREGIPFVYFGVEDHPGYHNPTDDFSDITPDFYYAASELILDAVLAFDARLDELPGK